MQRLNAAFSPTQRDRCVYEEYCMRGTISYSPADRALTLTGDYRSSQSICYKTRCEWDKSGSDNVLSTSSKQATTTMYHILQVCLHAIQLICHDSLHLLFNFIESLRLE